MKTVRKFEMNWHDVLVANIEIQGGQGEYMAHFCRTDLPQWHGFGRTIESAVANLFTRLQMGEYKQLVRLSLVESDEYGDEWTSESWFTSIHEAADFAKKWERYNPYGIGRISDDIYGGEIVAWVEWEWNKIPFEIKYVASEEA